MVQERNIIMVDLNELLKKGLLKKGSDPSLIITRLPLGLPALDELLGGGLPWGRFIETYGPESTGKTLIAQLSAAAVQQTEHPQVLYMDMENSYDERWWKQSGVDTDKLLVSSPATAEQAIDIIVAMLENSSELGLIILDSIAAMTPAPEADPEKSSEDAKQPGLQARVITHMFRKVKPLLKHTIFMMTNQMRDNIGSYDELAALPGGKAQRHFAQIILRIRRENWITDNNSKDRKGFYMEIISRKNKTCGTPDGASITLPFLFTSQIDLLTSYIESGLKKGLIIRKGPYYHTKEQSFLGMANLRKFYEENPIEADLLKTNIA